MKYTVLGVLTLVARTLVGVDVGSYSVKCVVLRRDESGFRTRFMNEYFLSDYFDGEESYPSPALDVILSDFVKRHRISRPLFCIALPCVMPYVVAQTFTMPDVPVKELVQGVRYELQSRASIEDMDVYHYQWTVLSRGDDGGYRVFASAIRQDVLESLMRLKRSGWSVLSVEPQVVSLGRVVSDNVAVIDFGHSRTGLMIYKNGVPCHIQSIDIGGGTLTDILEREYGDSRQAVELKHEQCAVLLGHQELEPNELTLRLSGLMESPVQQLAAELKRSLRSVEIAENFVVDTVYFTGNAARLRYLPEYLSRELEQELVPMSLTDRGMDIFGDYSFTLASGAWLFRDHVFMKDINFARVSRRRLFQPGPVHYRRALACLLAFGVLLNVGMYDLRQRVDDRIAQVDSWQRELQGEISKLQGKIDAVDVGQAYEFMERLLSMPSSQRTYGSDVLYQLPLSVPANVMLQRIVLAPREGRIRLRGLSQDYSGIGFLAIDLERHFSQPAGAVEILSYEAVEGGYSFEIDLVVQPW